MEKQISDLISIDKLLEKKLASNIPIIVKLTHDAVKGCLTMDTELNRLDMSIGKSIKPGCRNITKNGDESLMFGLSTNKLNSMNNKTLELCNFSDIVSPKSFEKHNLNQNDVESQKTKEEILEILNAVGLNYKMGMFEGVWKKAIQIEAKHDYEVVTKYTVCISSIINAIKELDALPEEYKA